jgi:diaminohydroxyphosphoribosylaminopyrimidine deaminase/5-amino-6-(5-phosphoribosylamino)uracil reductase
MLVGTQTIAIDDPRLTVRDEHDRPLPHQPLRAVMGLRDLDRSRRVFDNEADTVHLRTRDPREALGSLFALGRRHVFLEGGPTLAAAFLREHLVDEIVAYIAPILLGDGLSAVSDVGVTTIADALRPIVKDIKILGGEHGDEQPNVRLTLQPR